MGILTPLFCLLLALSSPTAAPTPKAPVTPVTPVKPTPPKPQPQPQKVRPGSKVNWIEFKARKKLSDASWGKFLTDIENHLDESLGNQYRDEDKNTWAHETTHGIHSWLNNNLQKKRTHYHLYVGNDKVAKIKQPKYEIKDVAKLIPETLQKSRYNLYLIKQQDGWNDEPIYLWDEWVAYCNGAQCGIELVNKGTYKPNKNDSVLGVLEFNVYATYVAIAQKKHDSDYDNKEMLEFLAWNLERGMKLFHEGQKLDVFNWDEGKYLKHLQTHDDAKEFRDFLIKNFGRDWTNEVFGFK